MMTPARRLLGAEFPYGEPLRKGSLIEFIGGYFKDGLRIPAEASHPSLPGGTAAFSPPSAQRLGGMDKKSRAGKAGAVYESPHSVTSTGSGYKNKKVMKKALKRHEIVHSIQSQKRGGRSHRKIRELVKDELGAYKVMDRRLPKKGRMLRRLNKGVGFGTSMGLGIGANKKLRKRALRYGGAAGAVGSLGVVAASLAKRSRQKDFEESNDMNELTMMTPARRLLGAEFPYGEPLRKGSLVELRRLTDEDELVKDRRTLKRGVIGGGLLAGTAVAIIRKGRVGGPVRVIRKGLRKNIKRGALLRKKGVITPGEATNLEQKRDKLSQVRDAAIIGGTGAVGVGALVAGREVAKTGKVARRAIDKGSAVLERTAKRVRTDVTPDALVDSAGKAVKRKVKATTKRMFPTFTKIGKRMVKNFETPAQRMGVMEFVAVAEPRQNRKQVVGRNNQYTDTLAVASGLKKGYDRAGGRQHVAIGDSRALRSAWGKAKEVNKWGTRGGRVVKDAADVVTGKPRQRDGSGRKKKREWEKSWAKQGMTNAAIGTGLLGYQCRPQEKPEDARIAPNGCAESDAGRSAFAEGSE